MVLQYFFFKKKLVLHILFIKTMMGQLISVMPHYIFKIPAYKSVIYVINTRICII